MTIIQANAERLPLPDQSVDLVIGSPPYVDARLYLEDGKDLGIARGCREWVEWMLRVTAESLRVSRGLVLWVVAGKTSDWCYHPAPEGLLWEWWRQGGESHLFRPCYWHRIGIPGSGHGTWYRADVEYVLAFKRPGPIDYGKPTANGHPPKYAPGGEMSYRHTDGKRANRLTRKARTNREVGGDMREQSYAPPVLANPGNLLSIPVGGGKLGSKLAHENEAPYPVDVPKWFINSHCPPGGTVLDPFSGSGSTLQAAAELGRNGIGVDLRFSQCKIAQRRMRSVTPGFRFEEATADAC